MKYNILRNYFQPHLYATNLTIHFDEIIKSSVKNGMLIKKENLNQNAVPNVKPILNHVMKDAKIK